MTARADYGHSVCRVVDDDRATEVLRIIDLDRGQMSVTNDIENVLVDVEKQLPRKLAEYAIIYRDSMDLWDEIELDDAGNFKAFKALPRLESFDEIQTEAVIRFLKRKVETG